MLDQTQVKKEKKEQPNCLHPCITQTDFNRVIFTTYTLAFESNMPYWNQYLVFG